MKKSLQIIAIGLVLCLAGLSTSYAQRIISSVKVESSKPFFSPKEDEGEWLRFDDGTTRTAIGAGATTYDVAIRFTPEDLAAYDGYEITMVTTYVLQVVETSTVMVWQGDNGASLEEIASQAFTPSAETWAEVTLDEPCTIDASKELWIGVRYVGIASTFPAGIDQESDHSGQGNLVRFPFDETDPAWYPLTDLNEALYGDWNIAVYVMPDDGFVNNAVKFNVDMTGVSTDIFDPASHKIYIAGSFPDATWSQPGTNEALELKLPSASKTPKNFSESFEDFDDFTTDLTPWTTIQVTEGDTWSASDFDFTGEGTAFAFMVFNPSETDPSINDAHPAQDGSKYAIAVQYTSTNDNKWLISPQLMGTSTSELSFWAKSITDAYGLERIKVMISTTDTDPGSFTKISTGDYLEVPTTWTEYTYDLSAYEGQEFYFAINYVSYDAFFCMLDNFAVTSEESEPIYSVTLDLPDGEYDYKYFVVKDNPSWDFGEWAGDPNRTVTVEGDMTINNVWAQLPTSVDEEVADKGTTLFPNPASLELNVNHSSRMNEIRVFDVTGRMVYASTVNGLTTTKVDLSNFNEGVYILQVMAQDGITSKKFVVKK